MDRRLDFEGLNNVLRGTAHSFLIDLFPGGDLKGREYMVGDLQGGDGDSLRININTGKWSDFATGESGGDLISLYAAAKGLNQGQAFKELSNKYSFSQPESVKTRSNPEINSPLIPPPDGTPPPDFGNASNVYTYKSSAGAVLFYICRVNTETGKNFFPFSWNGTKWVNKQWPEPRPLYGLEYLKPEGPILIVEGEKAADAARILAKDRIYSVISWPGGANAYAKANWQRIKNRDVVMWPDADPINPKTNRREGTHVMEQIAAILQTKTNTIKIIDVTDLSDKSDAADFTGNWTAFREWAVARSRVYTPPKPESAKSKTRKDQDNLNEQVREANAVIVDVNFDDVQINTARDLMALIPKRVNVFDLEPESEKRVNCPVKTAMNVVTVLEKLGWNDLVWWDDFYQTYLTRWGVKRGQYPRRWEDRDTTNLMIALQGSLFKKGLHKSSVLDAFESFTSSRRRDEPKDWMLTLKWDETPRVKDFFVRVMATERTEFVDAVSKNFWVSLAARTLDPGCKADEMVVIEGIQGSFKSSALQLIGQRWFSELTVSPGRYEDFVTAIQGKLLIEIPELDAFRKAEVEAIKAALSMRVDDARRKYGRMNIQSPRRCIFAGTTNEEEYLKDPTGGRRFWPIKTGLIDLEYIAKYRDQLFAEAVHLYQTRHNWYEVPWLLAKEEQDSRRIKDPWEEAIIEWARNKLKLYSAAPGVRVDDAINECLEIPLGRVEAHHKRRVSAILRSNGYENKLVWSDEKPVRYWVIR